MRIVDNAADELASVPGECCMTVYTEHLVTPVYLADALAALRARLGLFDNHCNRGLQRLIARVWRVLVLALHHHAVRARPELACSTLVGTAQESTALGTRALHDELGLVRLRRLLTFCHRPCRRGTTLALRREAGGTGVKTVSDRKNLLLLLLDLDQRSVGLGNLLADLTQLDLGFDTRLACRKNGHLTLKQHVLPVRLVRTRAEGACEVGVEEVVVPGSVAVHAVCIEQAICQVPLATDGAGRVVAVSTHNRLSQLCRVLVEANGTLGGGGHFL